VSAARVRDGRDHASGRRPSSMVRSTPTRSPCSWSSTAAALAGPLDRAAGRASGTFGRHSWTVELSSLALRRVAENCADQEAMRIAVADRISSATLCRSMLPRRPYQWQLSRSALPPVPVPAVVQFARVTPPSLLDLCGFEGSVGRGRKETAPVEGARSVG
jgi:hypothetical protein